MSKEPTTPQSDEPAGSQDRPLPPIKNPLTPEEIAALRKDAQESSDLMDSILAQRRAKAK